MFHRVPLFVHLSINLLHSLPIKKWGPIAGGNLCAYRSIFSRQSKYCTSGQSVDAVNVTMMIDNSVLVVMKPGNYELYLNDAKFGNHDFINCVNFFEY